MVYNLRIIMLGTINQLHEIYAHPFLRSVAAGVTSIMCSYNLVNGTYACEDDNILNVVLKHQLGFQGCKFQIRLKSFPCNSNVLLMIPDVMSDWDATHSTISAVRGLDVRLFGLLVILTWSNVILF